MPRIPSLTHQAAKLVPYPSDNKHQPVFELVHDFEPPTELAKLGNLYIVAEFLTSASHGQQIGELIIRSLTKSYYQTGDSALSAEARFEAAIKQLNRRLRELVAEGKDQSLAGASAIVAIVTDDELLLARGGGAGAMLLRDDKLHHLFGHDHESGTTPDRSLFTSFAHGHLRSGDHILLCTPEVLHEQDDAGLKQVLALNTPQTMIEFLHTNLAEHSKLHRSGAITISLSSYQAASHQPLPVTASMVRSGQKPSVAKKVQDRAKPVAISVVKNTSKYAKSSKEHFKNRIWPRFLATTKKLWNLLWIKLINKNPRLAALVGGGVLLAIILLFTIVIRPHSSLDHDLAAYKSANMAYLTAQAQMSDGNRAQASQTLESAEASLNQLSHANTEKLDSEIKKDKTITDKLTLAQLRVEIAQLSDKITLTLRPSPTTLYTLPDKKAQLNQIVQLNGDLFSLSGNKVVVYDLGSKQVTQISTTIPANSIIAATADPNRQIIYWLSAQSEIWAYNTATKQSNRIQLSFGDWPKATDIAFYNSSLYLLSPESRQITRHNPTGIGFGPGVPYIKQSSSNLTSIRSLAINGSIFVGDTTGQIGLYSLGLQKDFKVTGLPYDLGWPKKLALSANDAQLMALNNKLDRIYSISLTDSGGVYKSQFKPRGITSIRSFTTDLNQKTIYFTSAGKILSFSP